MYHAFYLYRVPKLQVERFLKIVGEAGVIYRKHGAVDSVMMRVTQSDGKYGCAGLFAGDAPAAHEQLFVGIDSFRSEEEFRTIGERIDADPEISRLYQEIQEIIDFRKLIRWEAEDTD